MNSLKIVHLYPDQMNIYGDMGNIIALKNRCEWRGIEVEVQNVTADYNHAAKIGDIYFMGGGQDNDMYGVFEDLLANKREYILREVENNKVFLLICGAFQLFGDYFLDATNRQIKGLGIIPAQTKAPGDALADRCLGNLVTEATPQVLGDLQKHYTGENMAKTFVGFENHSGQTFFDRDKVSPIGAVVKGKGNNAIEKIEGARYKNVFGSYTHGSFLPKNPHMADLLISLAMQNKYGPDFKLQPLDDEIEWQAHQAVAK